MRKTWKLALASVALVSGVAFTACSSDDEELLSGGSDTTAATGETGEVKTTISFAIPHAKTQRSTADYVQEGSIFKGMQNIYLMQFQVNRAGDTVASTSSFMGLMKNLDDIEATNGLSGSVKTYSNIKLLPGNTAFLLYGETKDKGNDGRLTPNYISSSLNGISMASDISFDLTTIDVPDATTFSKALLNLRGCLRTHWGSGEGAMQTIFSELKEGKSSVAKEQLTYLLSQLRSVVSTESEQYGLTDSIGAVEKAMNEFYGDGYKLPAAIYEFDWSKEEPNQMITMNKDIIESGSQISYPPSLYYRTNSWPVTYSSSSSFGDDPITITSSMTTGVGLKKSVNYAVGRLDVKVKASSSSLTDNNKKSVSLTLPSGEPAFTLTGVIVGGQPASVDFTFTNNTSDWNYMIYDNDIIPGKEGITSTNIEVNTYILGLPSQKYESSQPNSGEVQIALEVRNDGEAFAGKDGIIPTDATFYLVGKLNPSSSSSSVSDPKQVFASDFYTTANLTITGLQNAMATLPDLTTSVTEFALSVDLEWKQGISIDANIGGMTSLNTMSF